MGNVSHSVKANKLIIEVDLTQEDGESNSGKSIKVGSTNGFVSLSDGMSFSLNVIKKKK